MKVLCSLRAAAVAVALLGGTTVVATEVAHANTPVAKAAVAKKYTITQLAGKQVKHLDEQCERIDGKYCSRYSALSCGISFDTRVKVTWFTCTISGFTEAGVELEPSQWSTADGVKLTSPTTELGMMFDFRSASSLYGNDLRRDCARRADGSNPCVKIGAMRCGEMLYDVWRDKDHDLQAALLDVNCRRSAVTRSGGRFYRSGGLG